ncbi:hypothetical protein PN4B1_48330 [Paenibacillus naphthalenovorans]|uniref:hypothetical protein n=1 Tax=Paenibacillus naphthalenovorans TaxID=162209 RepID=UPI0010B9A637|nr:hypothetical protein [Paenibacillus naphthalenovorans]GCL74851.1 hypothetical protein PN4B1_48330 [Paenibacillus naphthalenovorans]
MLGVERIMDYITFIKNEIEMQGYLTAQELNQKLSEQFHITPANCRKIVQRMTASGKINSTSPITFGNNQYVYFTRPLNKSAIKHITKKHRPSLYRLIVTLENSQGVLSYYEALKVTSSPVDREKTKMDHLDRIIQDLLHLGLIMELQTYNSVTYIIDKLHGVNWPSVVKSHECKMKLDCTFIRDVLIWLKKHNVINREEVVYRSKNELSKGAQHNNFVWDAFAYSSATGITNDREDGKNTLVVLDVQLSRPYSQQDLDGFYNRVQGVICSSSSRKRKVLPIIIINEIAETGVQNRIRKLGFLSFHLGTIYGERIYEVLKSLDKINELFRFQSHPVEVVSEVTNILENLRESGQETNLQNLKGDLFEFLMYSVLRRIIGEGYIEQSVVLKEKNSEGKVEYYEYDLIIQKGGPRERIVFELKGYKGGNEIKLGDQDSKNTVRWFFRRTFPFAKRYYGDSDKPNQHPMKACYITTARFSEEALETLNKLNESGLKPSMLDVYYDGQKLIKLMKEREYKKELDVLEKYYL